MEVIFVSVIIETDRLQLCVFYDEYLEASKSFWGDEEVMAHCSGATPEDLLVKIISGYRKCHEANGISVYAVKELSTNKVIGAAGFNISNSLETVELIYHFSKASWGKGYATEAAKACLEIAKYHGNIKYITASADPQNENSFRILEKIGFKNKGLKYFEDSDQEEPFYEYVI